MPFILQDNRTKRYWGGGRSDKLFSYWVEDAKSAKIFSSKEDIKPVIEGLIERNNSYGVDVIRNTMTEIPPYEDDAYIILEVIEHQQEKTDSVRSIRSGQILNI